MRRTAAVLALLRAGGRLHVGQPSPDDEPERQPAEVSTGRPARRPALERDTVPSASPTPTEEPLPEVHSPLSLPALMRQPPSGGRPRILRTEYATDAYTRHDVTYRSDDLTVSGVLIRPRGKGPFPAIVLNHGYIEPSFYVTGQGLAREQDALARAGFVVLHTDYRGHAASDPVPPVGPRDPARLHPRRRQRRRGAEELPYVDAERLACWAGRWAAASR